MSGNNYVCNHRYNPQFGNTSSVLLLLYSHGRMYTGYGQYDSTPKTDEEIFPFLKERNAEKLEEFEYETVDNSNQ